MCAHDGLITFAMLIPRCPHHLGLAFGAFIAAFLFITVMAFMAFPAFITFSMFLLRCGVAHARKGFNKFGKGT